MTLLKGLEVVTCEYRGKGENRLCDAIPPWWLQTQHAANLEMLFSQE